jgi:hypothetical protein
MEVLKMTFIDGHFLELEKVLAMMLDTPEKERSVGLYEKLKDILSQPETVKIIGRLENYVARNKHLIETNEFK